MKKAFTACFISVLFALIISGCSLNQEFNPQSEISVISREDGSGTRGAFIELFGIEEKGNGYRKDKTTKEASIVSKTDVMLSSIVNNQYAIGYGSLGSVNSTIKVLDIDGVTPSEDNVKNNSYNIYRPFIIATSEQPNKLVTDFTNFILSNEGQDLVSETYISISDDLPEFKENHLDGKIVISGSSSVAPIMEKLIEKYNSINPDAVFELQISDSSSGINALSNGICDIAMLSRDLKDSEKEDTLHYEIALDAIVLMTNPNNPVDNLTNEQVHDIFTGEISTWDLAK